MLPTRANVNSVNPDHIYYDLSVTNNQYSKTGDPPVLSFTDTRSSPILQNPSEYYCSVIRFSVDTPSLPIIIPQVKVSLSSATTDDTIYSFSMSYKTFNYQQFIQYSPQDKSQPVPALPLEFQDITNAYYYVYSAQYWISLCNVALLACYNGLKAAVIAGGQVLPSNFAPYLEWNVSNATAILVADQAGYLNTLANPINVFCNNPAFTLFSSFPFLFLGLGNLIAFGKNYQFIIDKSNGTYTTPSFTGLTCIQEYPTAPNWCPIQSILFTSSLLPTFPSNVGVPQNFGISSAFSQNGANNNISSILTDFEVDLVTGLEYLPQIQYAPTAEYRLIDLISNQPLNSIELSCFWKDVYGGLHPLQLLVGCSANLKLLFRKKSFNAQK
jgi:hypothetical protein